LTLGQIYARRAELLRELAATEADLAAALAQPAVAPSPAGDEALDLTAAAGLFNEPPNTFRQRLEYRKALISRPGERRLRYSRVALERILMDRLAVHR
jgi:hypothetical protein